MKEKKAILFLSPFDFSDKSIQVIRKTIEAYVTQGWSVDFVVARDLSKYGSYYYQAIINPAGVNVTRFNMPSTWFFESVNVHVLRTIYSKLRNYIITLKLAFHASHLLKNKKYDVIYGWGPQGILAMNLLKLFGKTRNTKTVSRYLGTFYLAPILKQKNYFKTLLNWDCFLSLYLRTDLFIMTNDGTMGDWVLRKIKSKSLPFFRFFVNGVDEQKMPADAVRRLKIEMGISEDVTVFLSLSRLSSDKRIDRGMIVVSKLIHDLHMPNILYFIVGDGAERQNLVEKAQELKITEHIVFTGGVTNSTVKNYLNVTNIFLSTFDSSNIGNPLLEAIRANKIICTLNNGDTSSWIQHKQNGFIYDIDDQLYVQMAKDIFELLHDDHLRDRIIAQVKKTETEKLWTWAERMHAEIAEVEKLLAS